MSFHRQTCATALLALSCMMAASCGTKDAQSAVPGTSHSAPPGANGAVSADIASSSTGASSQQSGGVEFYPAAALDRIAASLAHGPKSTEIFGRHTTYFYVQARRVVTGEPEVHDQWIDLAVVQAGRATLLTGGRVDGSRIESPGEQRGGKIVGGTTRAVAIGDLIVIPAGIPHQYQLSRGDSIRYLTIKVAKP
jgi:hypothetical protein